MLIFRQFLHYPNIMLPEMNEIKIIVTHLCLCDKDRLYYKSRKLPSKYKYPPYVIPYEEYRQAVRFLRVD